MNEKLTYPKNVPHLSMPVTTLARFRVHMDSLEPGLFDFYEASAENSALRKVLYDRLVVLLTWGERKSCS